MDSIRGKPMLLGLIPFIGIIFTLLLSVRQQAQLESFLPPISVGIPILTRKILFDIRSRLPVFRYKYSIRFSLIMLFLLFGNLVLFGNKLTYLFQEHRNFAYSFYGAKDIARQLHDRGLTSIRIPNAELATRLRFYGINANPSSASKSKYRLLETKNGDIVARILGVTTARYSVFKD